MKKITAILLSVLAVMAMVSCDKEETLPENPDQGTETPENPGTDDPDDEVDGPTIAWDSNSSFGKVNIDDNLNAVLDITAPAGIKSLTVTVDSDQLEGALTIAGITSPNLDLINDQKVIGFLSEVAPSLPAGDKLLDETEVEFDITELVKMINDVTDEESDHSFIVNVTDKNDKKDEKKCTFHRVAEPAAAPTVVWTANTSGETKPIDSSLDAKLAITAEAGIKSVSLTIDEFLRELLGLDALTFDIINDQAAISRLESVLGQDFPTGNDLLDKTEAELDLAPLTAMMVKNGEHTVSVTVTDKNGQSSTPLACKFQRENIGGPTASWTDNMGFSPVNIDEDLSVVLSCKSPAMFKSVRITVPEALATELKNHNIENPVDIVNDADAVSYFSEISESEFIGGDKLRYSTQADINLTSLVKMLNDVISDGSMQMLYFVFEDYNGVSVQSLPPLMFYPAKSTESGLSITWPGNEDFEEWDFSSDHKPEALHIAAPAGIKTLSINIKQDDALYNLFGTESFDLLNKDYIQSEVIEAYAYDFIAPSLNLLLYGADNISNKTELDLNINGFIEILICDMYRAAGTHIIGIHVEDNDGNTQEVTCTFITE